jgi:hypothetical protein
MGSVIASPFGFHCCKTFDSNTLGEHFYELLEKLLGMHLLDF